jgi:hypothetical protein
MCDNPTPCACTIERRKTLRAEAIARSDAFRDLARRLHGQITDDEAMLLYRQAETEWDDAIHIAAPSDPLRSLCGQLGRNLADLPERPGGGSGCWTCLQRADELARVPEREAVAA